MSDADLQAAIERVSLFADPKSRHPYQNPEFEGDTRGAEAMMADLRLILPAARHYALPEMVSMSEVPWSDEQVAKIVNTSVEQIDILRARVALLEGALKPFSDKAKSWALRHPQVGRYPIRDGTQITHRLGDFRNAAAALKDTAG